MAHPGALEAYHVTLETYHEAMEAHRRAKSDQKYEHLISTLLKRTSKSKLKSISLNKDFISLIITQSLVEMFFFKKAFISYRNKMIITFLRS